MQVTIKYEFVPTNIKPYMASTKIGDNYIVGCGTSWENCRQRLMEKIGELRLAYESPPPPDEVIELPTT